MKFSIRDLLWLTVVVALALTWWLDRRELRRRYEKEASDAAMEALAREVQVARAQIELATLKNDAELAKVQAEELRARGSPTPAAP
jgi:hypothetical protein